MAQWLYDEDIAKVTVKKFESAGFRGKHITYDLDFSGKEDFEVLQIGKSRKETLITANPRDFLRMKPHQIKTTSGVWILKTQDPDEQVYLTKKVLIVAGLKTKKSRKGKRVYITKGNVVVDDCSTQEKIKIKLNKR